MIKHSSVKEERDDLLFYKSVDIKRLKRVNLLGIPIDNLSQDEAMAYILSAIEKKKSLEHVFFLDPIKLVRLVLNQKLKSIVQRSSLILAEGGGLLWAAKTLRHPLKERIPKISLLMDILRLAVRNDFTIYLLGLENEIVERVFLNLQKSFSGIRIVGRQAGHFGHEREHLVKESIRKSAPDLIFLGMNFPKQELWIRENESYLNKAVVVGVDDAFDTLSGIKKKVPDYFQLRGLNWLWYTIIQPWSIGRILQAMGFYLVCLFKTIFVLNKVSDKSTQDTNKKVNKK